MNSEIISKAISGIENIIQDLEAIPTSNIYCIIASLEVTKIILSKELVSIDTLNNISEEATNNILEINNIREEETTSFEATNNIQEDENFKKRKKLVLVENPNFSKKVGFSTNEISGEELANSKLVPVENPTFSKKVTLKRRRDI
jgi:hypothetical protein